MFYVAKEIVRRIKLQIPAGKATPAPPVGTALGPAGINLQEFCTKYNDATRDKMGDIIPVDMSCNSQIKKFKALGVWHTDSNIQSGDILYYDWDRSGDADHVGIVEKANNSLLTVIEGNNGNYPDDKVRRREIYSESFLIFGYARPDYSKLKNNISFPLLRKGDAGTYVKILQAFLTAYRYNIGNSEIDGEFGSDTESAVKQFQKNSEIEVDGIVGEDTWNKLFK